MLEVRETCNTTHYWLKSSMMSPFLEDHSHVRSHLVFKECVKPAVFLSWSLSPPVLAHHFLSLFLLSSVCLCLGVKFVLVFQSWDTSWVPALWLHAPGSNELTCSSSSHFMCGGLPSVFAGLKLVPLLVVFAMFFPCESYLPCCLLSGNRRAGTCAWWQRFWGEKELWICLFVWNLGLH